MDEKKFCFILCGNDEQLERYCTRFIQGLHVPEGFRLEYQIVHGATSMTQGYNQAMRQSDAKYKIYIHQDVYVVYKEMLFDLLRLFENSEIGMVGLAGTPKMPLNGIMWDTPRIGKWYECNIITAGEYGRDCPEKPMLAVEAVDGMFIATQYDLPWREDLFQGWDFYDISQSFEFRRKGYQVVVPYIEDSWCLHNDGIMNLMDYFKWRDVFAQEYGEMLHE